MIFIILIITTFLIIAWLILLSRVSKDDWIAAAHVKAFDNYSLIAKLQSKAKHAEKKLTGYTGIVLLVARLFWNADTKKRIFKLEREIELLKNGDLSSVSVFIMPGYVLQREFNAIGKGSVHKLIMSKCFELYGKKYAGSKTKQLLAQIISYPVIGVAFSLLIGVIFLAIDSTTVGIGIIVIGSLLVMVLVYALYDELSDLIKKRRSAIIKQFPNVVSKLALLVTSGMIMDRAWKEAAYSQETELYQEMRKTSKELDNLVSPELAYSAFINRCNTKESAKLASAIMQNLSKGNAEIGKLLKDMAREAWQERRHTAKRDAEKANSKLMIPTMMLFLAILVMLMVPIAMSFSGI